MSQERKFDGVTVDLHSGRFTGSFDVDDAVLIGASIDDVVTIVVTARVNGATIAPTRNGELKRIDRYAILNVAALDKAASARIAQTLGLTLLSNTPQAQPVQAQPLPPQTSTPVPTPVAAPVTTIADLTPGRWGEAGLIYADEDGPAPL